MPEGMTGATVDRVLDERIDDGGTRHADWFCLRLRPWKCDCGQTIRYLCHNTELAEHLIVVWPSREDPNLREELGKLDSEAAIVPFENSFGKAISYYKVVPS